MSKIKLDFNIDGVIWTLRHIVRVSDLPNIAEEILRSSGYTKNEFTKSNNRVHNFSGEREKLQQIIDSF